MRVLLLLMVAWLATAHGACAQAVASTEREWIDSRIASDTKDMLAFSAARKKTTAKYDAAAVAPDVVLRRLSENSMGALKEQNDLVSAALTANPGNAELHEEAAMVWWCFEELGLCRMFTDKRFGHARMNAHLAVAKKLRKGAATGFCGRLAEAALDGTTASAEALMKDATTPNEKSWARTLMIVAANDPKLMDKDDFSALEEYEAVERIAALEGAFAAANYFREHHAKPSMQWFRVVNNVDVPVALGNTFAIPFFRTEMLDFGRDAQLWGKRSDVAWKTISPDLNLEPTPAVVGGEIKLITYADIAAWHQRQLMHAFHCVYAMYHRKLQMKDAASELLKLGRERLGPLRLYPFIECTMDTNDTVWESYVPKAVDVVTQAPYMVPQRVWLEACRYKACAPLRERADVWFK